MNKDMIGVLVIEAPANPHVIAYWRNWLNSRGLPNEIRDTTSGKELYRLMTTKEYEDYKVC